MEIQGLPSEDYGWQVTEAPFLAAHCRAGRALLELTQEQLALKAGVGRMTVKRFEASETIRPAQAAAIRRALEEAGVAFISDCTCGDGVAVAIGVGLLAGQLLR
jgi:transcriptional regulator with XRE-family HTH domain